MNYNGYHAGSATMPVELRLAVSALCLLALLAAAAPPAGSQTVTFKYTCTDCQPTLDLATMVGQLASDSNTIASVQSDVQGYTNPVPISGGLLTLESSPATYAYCYGNACDATFGFRGGSAAIVGSVFGLPSGSTLLTAFFGPGATETYLPETTTQFSGGTIVLYVDPTILANLGMTGLPNVGSGNVNLGWYLDPDHNYLDGYLTVTFTPARAAAKQSRP